MYYSYHRPDIAAFSIMYICELHFSIVLLYPFRLRSLGPIILTLDFIATYTQLDGANTTESKRKV